MTARSLIPIIFITIFIFFAGCSQSILNDKTSPDKKIADELSTQIKTIGPIDDSIFYDYAKFKDFIIKINHLISIINENLQTEIPEIGSTISDFEKIKGMRTVLKYSPIINPYNQLYGSAIKLPSEKKTDYDQFYLDLGKFSVDICFIESKISYKLAYKATGDIAYKFKLYKFVPYVGYEGYRIMLSGIHWYLRGRIDNQSQEIMNFLLNQTPN